MIHFGMSSAQIAAANAAMSQGTTYSDFHILIVVLTAVSLMSFALASLYVAYQHFAENDLSVHTFVTFVVALVTFLVMVGIFLVV